VSSNIWWQVSILGYILAATSKITFACTLRK